ncbi:CSN complex subunit 8 [Aspergillus desertorum]
MDLPPLSLDQLSAVIAAAPAPADLYTLLSDYEEQACLLSTTDINERDLLLEFYTIFFFSHLLTDQICEARALIRRVPQELSQTDGMQTCSLLLRAIWQSKHAEIYKILRELPWPERSHPLVQRYESHFQEKTLAELSNSYETIRVAAAATYLGLDPVAVEGDLIGKFTACGWRWDSGKQLLYPKPVVAAPPKDDSSPNELSRVMALISNQGS